jgi:hypothetical protein
MYNSTRAAILAFAIFTLSSSYTNAGQDVYRWIDAQGNQVNSDRPPPSGTDYEVISTRSSMVRPVDSEEGVIPPKAEPTVSNNVEPVNSKKRAVEKNPEYCATAKDNLTQIDNHVRIRLRDDQGEFRILSTDEKAAERQKALDAIEAFCE